MVGESGSGKSTLAAAVMQLLPDGVQATAGSIELLGQDLRALAEPALRQLRGRRMAMVFQDPMTALNPLQPVGRQIAEVMLAHRAVAKAQVPERVLHMLREVGIGEPAAVARRHPHQLSGGQRQRVMIAMALALEPALLIADEPTTALDVTTQAQILRLMRDIQRRRGMGVLFITHDLGVVAEIADRVVVLRDGCCMESGPAAEVLGAPRHAYTRALLDATPTGRPASAASAASATAPVVLQASGLHKRYQQGTLFRRGPAVAALHDVGFTLRRGRTLGIIGESGSGKSTLARCLMRLETLDDGAVTLDGRDLLRLRGGERRRESRRLQMVFQDPYSSLNPRKRVGYLVAQGLLAHGMPATQALRRAAELLEMVGLPAGAVHRWPHEFSGGQRQRIGIARAIALEPDVLIADEAVSALDVSVQAQILGVLQDLQRRLSLSLVFITHDLRVAGQICDDLLVLQGGRVVEHGPAAQVLDQPRSDYTRQLIDAIPGRRLADARAPAPDTLRAA